MAVCSGAGIRPVVCMMSAYMLYLSTTPSVQLCNSVNQFTWEWIKLLLAVFPSCLVWWIRGWFEQRAICSSWLMIAQLWRTILNANVVFSSERKPTLKIRACTVSLWLQSVSVHSSRFLLSVSLVCCLHYLLRCHDNEVKCIWLSFLHFYWCIYLVFLCYPASYYRSSDIWTVFKRTVIVNAHAWSHHLSDKTVRLILTMRVTLLIGRFI